MKASAWPTVGSRMSPRGSLGFGSMAKRRSLSWSSTYCPRTSNASASRSSAAFTSLAPRARRPHGLPTPRRGAGPQLGGQVDVLQRLAYGEPAYVAVVVGEAAVAEDGENRFVVTIGTSRPLASTAARRLSRARWRVAASAPNGTTSSSWNVTPDAPISARRGRPRPGPAAGGSSPRRRRRRPASRRSTAEGEVVPEVGVLCVPVIASEVVDVMWSCLLACRGTTAARTSVCMLGIQRRQYRCVTAVAPAGGGSPRSDRHCGGSWGSKVRVRDLGYICCLHQQYA